MLKITKSPQISEEIVMDVFVKLWIGRELLPDVQQFEKFLHKVAYYKAIDFLRMASRQARLQEAYIERMEREPEKRADELLIDAESRKLIREAIHRLPPQRKLIYTLSREEGLTHHQIAEALNLSPNTVKNSIVSATRSISDFLRKNNAGKAALSFLLL
jgi:RNA polymerase sigma-70 factor (ECF subfamily)